MDTLLSVVSTTAVVPSPLIKFTVSYGLTRSLASPLFCKFQPAFNTSPTVAAFFLIFGKSAAAGPSEDVVGSSVPSFAPGRLPATFVIGLLFMLMPSALVTIPPTLVLSNPFKSFANLNVKVLPFS